MFYQVHAQLVTVDEKFEDIQQKMDEEKRSHLAVMKTWHQYNDNKAALEKVMNKIQPILARDLVYVTYEDSMAAFQQYKVSQCYIHLYSWLNKYLCCSRSEYVPLFNHLFRVTLLTSDLKISTWKLSTASYNH